MAIIEGRGVTKYYNSLLAVDNVDFSIDEAECFGFLGPNGAGKTTIMKMIYCRIPVTSGDIVVDGLSVRQSQRKIKSTIGVATQEDDLDRDLTVYENLWVYSRYFDLRARESKKRIDELLSFFDLGKKRDTTVDDLSGGMKRKLSVARALINDPRILILDEPTTGLDPAARRQIWDTVIKLGSEGKTVILTTHYMEEAQELCDRIALVFGGKILEYGSPDEIIGRVIGTNVCELYAPSDQALNDVRKTIPGSIEQVGNRLFVYGNDAGALQRQCEAATGVSQHVRPATLEDVFMKLTGREVK
ncbi:ABC transporter ATP binding protein [Methanocella paludicola SANAE]|uniref:ABC transporter ATP binding protein n=1 Tax=Methanocella paludicola (strain DSM 17711 / JCM 13418 / NBRC 101707 / SANAE) TaxID=304371 RepID=D1Z1L2_METPS|nr:ATP-binding cassette domain-containing protein [Methanocella paludicola]BAI62584.1 ABC transporter ATP binding protein [Methanocella paludicola SANAE]